MKRQARKSRLGQFSKPGSRKLHVESLEHRRMLATFAVEAGGSIQEAIEAAAASPGADTIQIAPGTYTENLDIEDSDPLTLSGNGVVIDGSGDDVIKIDDSDVTIRNLTITNGDDGIDAKDSSLTLVNVNASDNDGRGVETDDMGSVTVIGGIFSNNGGDGIKVDTADTVTIIGASFNNNNDGLDLEVIGSISLRNVEASGNGDEGLEVDDSGTVSVVNGLFTGNADDGIDIDNSTWISVVNVVSTGNGGNGLQIEADAGESPIEHVSVVRGVFSGNGENGIQIVEEVDDDNVRGQIDEVSLTSIKSTDNAEKGLDIDVSGDLSLKSIKTSGNADD